MSQRNRTRRRTELDRSLSALAEAVTALAAAQADANAASALELPPLAFAAEAVPTYRYEVMPARSVGLEHIGCLVEIPRTTDVPDAVRTTEPATATRIGRLVGVNPGGMTGNNSTRIYFRKLVLQYGDSQPHPVTVALSDPIHVRIETHA